MSGYVYPRLDPDEAMKFISLMRKGKHTEPAFRDSCSIPIEVGTVVPESVLKAVRHSVEAAVAPWNGAEVPSSQVAEWDRVVGKALHETMGIIPSDASHDGPWAFVTLIVLPDIAVTRFPTLHESRFLGGMRNTFRRCWWRQQILGDLELVEGVMPLGEDELVGIFERSKMARDHRLAKAVAKEILSYRGSDRSAFARELAKLVRLQTGPILIDAIPSNEVSELVQARGRIAAMNRVQSGSSGDIKIVARRKKKGKKR